MNWRDHERIYRHQEKERARLEADQLDREMNPRLYLKEPVAVLSHSDLSAGDAGRDEGKHR